MIKSPYATQFTRQQMEGKREPQRDMKNRKPFRTMKQKMAVTTDNTKVVDGRHVSTAPVSYHN